MNTLVHYIDANEMKSQRIKGLTASDLDHLCRFFFHENTQKKMEKSKASQQQYFRFSVMLKREEKFIQPS